MDFKFVALIAFAVCQNPASAQQQGSTQVFIPGGWVRPFYSAAAEAWREYFIRAQQATNQIYQQWANLTGNPLNNALGGLYGGGSTSQSGATNQPARPLQGIFSQNGPIQSGLQLSELLPAAERPTQDASGKAVAQDAPQDVPQIQQSVAPAKPQAPVQQAAPQPAQPAQPTQPQQTIAAPVSQQNTQTQPQQQTSAPTQVPGRPAQGLGQTAPATGLFGAANPLGWMG